MSDIKYKQEPWSLEDLFSGFDSPEFRQSLDRIEELVCTFEAFRPRLTEKLEPAEFMDMTKAYEQITREVYRLFAFCSLRFAADTQDQQAQATLAQAQQMAADSENRSLFFKLWWKNLEESVTVPFLDAAGDYRYFLEALRLERPYTLSEPEERVINLKDVNGVAALVTLLSTITDRYTFMLEVDGQEKELTRDELQVHYRHPDPNMRAAAYQELFRVYEQDKPVLGQIYQYIARDWYSECVGLRNYASPIAVRNLANDIPDDVTDILLDVCRQNATIFQRYFRLKARWLGVEKLRRYDIYAPVVKSDKRYDFASAVEMVLTSFRHFDPQMADLAERVFSHHHIDSEVRKGKRGGAFCATILPEMTPWVLQSYQGRADDVATMAHELGHAVHSLLAAHHTSLTQNASLALAETASTFGEMLVIDRLLAGDPDPETSRDLLFRQMDNNYATIMRQAYFAMFEREAHDRIQAGAMIDDLSELYAENLARQFGDSIELSEEFRLEWLMIPHIFNTPFYVYAYAFGQLLVLSLYQQYLEEGDAFKDRYLAILSAGGSDSPIRILERAGIDVHSAAFWQGGFDVLEDSLVKLEALEITG